MPKFNVGDVVRYRKPVNLTNNNRTYPAPDYLKHNTHWIVIGTTRTSSNRHWIGDHRLTVTHPKLILDTVKERFLFENEVVLVRRAPKKKVKK